MSGFDQGDRFERLQGDLRRLKKERDRLKERLAEWTLLHGKEKARVRELEAELAEWKKVFPNEGYIQSLEARAEKLEQLVETWTKRWQIENARVAELEARYCPDPNVRLMARDSKGEK